MEATVVAVTLFGVVSFAYSAAAGNNSDYDRVYCYPPDQIHTVIGRVTQVSCQTQSVNDPFLYPVINGDRISTNASEGIQASPKREGVNCRFDSQKDCVELPISITGVQELNGSIFQCCVITADTPETCCSSAVNITVYESEPNTRPTVLEPSTLVEPFTQTPTITPAPSGIDDPEHPESEPNTRPTVLEPSTLVEPFTQTPTLTPAPSGIDDPKHPGTPQERTRNANANRLAVILPSVIIPLAVIAVTIATLILAFIWRRRHDPHKDNKDTDPTDHGESRVRGDEADSYNSEDESSEDILIMVTPL